MELVQNIVKYIRREYSFNVWDGTVAALFRRLPEGGEYVPSVSGPPVKVVGDYVFLPTTAPVRAAERLQILHEFGALVRSPAQKARDRARARAAAADEGEE